MKKTIITYKETLKLSDSIRLNYTSKAPEFLDLDNKFLKDFIYGHFFLSSEYNLHNIKEALKEKSQRVLKKYIEIITNNYKQDPYKESKWIGEEELSIEYESSDYLIIAITSYYCLGADRGKSSEYHVTVLEYKVFDIKKNKQAELKEIIPSINWTEIIKNTPIDKTLFRVGKYKGLKIRVDYRKDCIVDEISAPNSFYFDDKNIYILYQALDLIDSEKSVVLEISKSFEEISPYLSDEFKERMGI